MPESRRHHARRSRDRNREEGTSFHFNDRVTINGFVVRGFALGDLVAYFAGPAPAAASSSATGTSNNATERVQNRRSRRWRRRTRHTTASRAGGPSRASFNNSEISISRLSIVDPIPFEDAEGLERSDHGVQSSIRSISSGERLMPLDVNDMGNTSTASASFIEGSTLVDGSTPAEGPTPVGEPTVLLQKLNRVSMDLAMGVLNPDSNAHSSDKSSGGSSRSTDYDESEECGRCDVCRRSAVTVIRGVDPAVEELAIPRKVEETPKGIINKVGSYFRSLPNKVKGFSLGQLLTLGRQSAPMQRS